MAWQINSQKRRQRLPSDTRSFQMPNRSWKRVFSPLYPFVPFCPFMLVIASGTAELSGITLGCELLSALLTNFDKTHSNKTYSYGHIWYMTMPDYQSILLRKFCHHVSWYIIVYQMYHITTLSHHRCPMLKRPEIHFPTNKQQNPQAAKWVIYKVT